MNILAERRLRKLSMRDMAAETGLEEKRYAEIEICKGEPANGFELGLIKAAFARIPTPIIQSGSKRADLKLARWNAVVKKSEAGE